MSKAKKIFLFACVPLIVLNIVAFTILFAPYPGKAITVEYVWSETLGDYIDKGTVLNVNEWSKGWYYEADMDQNGNPVLSSRQKMTYNVILLREVPYEAFSGECFRRATILETWCRPRLELSPVQLPPLPASPPLQPIATHVL